MRLWRPRRRERDLSRRELLDGIRGVAGQLRMTHEHTVTTKRIPKPPNGELVIKCQDGSYTWRYYVNCGRGALTMVDVPMSAIDPKASQADMFRIEFQWHD